MSCFIPELLVPKDSDSLLGACCQRCRYQNDCPYVYDQALYRAAHQGHVAAQLLTAEADQLLETISSADDIRCLLNSDRALEHALSHVLCLEKALIHELCARTINLNP